MENTKSLIIEPIFTDTPFAILMSANNNFMKYAAVMIQSIIETSTDGNNYDIVILHQDVDNVTIKKIESMVLKTDNVNIRFFDVSEIVSGYNLYTGRNSFPITSETYFRLLASAVFSDKYEKIIYLDGDMIALTDIAELYGTDIEGYFLAAARDITGIASSHKGQGDLLKHRTDNVGLINPDNYFIAGLLVINLPLLRKEYPGYSLFDIATSRKWKQHDQDVLNMICANGNARIIDLAWNVMQDYGFNSFLPDELKKEQRQAETNPKIIHFGGSGKPWERDVIRQTYFWETAARTDFFDDIVMQLINKDMPYETSNIALAEDINHIQESILSSDIEAKYCEIVERIIQTDYFQNNSDEKVSIVRKILELKYQNSRTVRKYERRLEKLTKENEKLKSVLVQKTKSKWWKK